MRLHHWTVAIKLNLHDLWIGLYWKRYPCAVDMYFCFLPALPINVYVQWRDA